MAKFVKREMLDPELEVLSRIANNMPCRRMDMGRVDTVYGPLYLTWGKDDRGIYHGLWGTCGMAQPIEFKEGTSEAMVKTALETSAALTVKELEAHGLVA